jgi:hypothetical protein
VLKFLFWFLVCANGALFAAGQGYPGTGDEREPARMKNQLNLDRIKLIAPATAAATAAAKETSGEASGEAPAAAPASGGAPAPVAVAKPHLVPCTEIGSFPSADARRFEQRIASLGLGQHQARRDVAVMEVRTHLVHIAPSGSKQAADKRASELTALGVPNYVMNDNSGLRWAISLGVFKSEAAAQGLLASLVKQGIVGAKIIGRGPSTIQVAFQFRGLDRTTLARLEQIRAAFPAQETRSCKA